MPGTSFMRFFHRLAPSAFVCFLTLFAGPDSGAFQRSEPANELPAIDKRAVRKGEASADKKAAIARLKSVVPGVQVKFDEKLGTLSWIGSPKSFLTGPKGFGRGVPQGQVERLPDNDPERPIKAFLNEHALLYGHGAEILNGARVKRQFTSRQNGVRTTVWEQQVDGIPVYESVLIGHLTANQELINISSSFVPQAEAAANLANPIAGALRSTPGILVAEAIVVAAEMLGVNVFAEEVMPLDEPMGAENLQHLAAGDLAGHVTAKLVWFPLAADRLILAWQLELTRPLPNDRYRVLVDARSGEILLRRRLTIDYSDAAYRVYPLGSPAPMRPGLPAPGTNQAPFIQRTLQVLSAISSNASPLGWLNEHANDSRGNNVDAHTDRNADDLPDLPRPVGSPFRTFDSPMDVSESPTNYTAASVIQLFYWCNFMHDHLYDLGFTEEAGNFQKDNLGRGGVDGDPVLADAQDGSGFDNANFTPTDDGEPPRIQMYIFDGSTPRRDGGFDADIVMHEYTHGLSTRLVGGGVGISSLQTSGMGEGWSDFYALALQTQPGEDPDATYPMAAYATYLLSGLTQNYYFGIRRYPYCTDLAKNPLTLKDIDPGQIDPHSNVPISPLNPFNQLFANEVHYQGEVWCVTLWEARSALVHKHGLENGNREMLQLVTDGMKLSPPNPTFLEARDAILQADLVRNAGANWVELWTAFAKRGMGFSATVPSNDSTSGVQEAYDLPDALLIPSSRNFIPSGPVGGPFSPSCITYLVTNTASTGLVWSASISQPWLSVQPAGGTLASKQSVQVTVCLTPLAMGLPLGSYLDQITFSNANSGEIQQRDAALHVMSFASVPFGDGFESGSLGPAWVTSGTGRYHTQVSSEHGPHEGSFHVTMDAQDSSGNYARNELTLGLDLGGFTNVVLQYWSRSFGDEPDGPPPFPFLEGANFDGVAISVDGITWYEAAGLRDGSDAYKKAEVHLDSVMAAAGLAYSPTFRIRFNQYDNFSIPIDGISVDDISVTGVAARRLVLAVPAHAAEGDGVLQASISVAVPPERDLAIRLTSSDTTKATVPATVILRAGKTNVTFTVSVVDNSLLDGTQTATLSAEAAGYYGPPAFLTVDDNEKAALKVKLAPKGNEGDGSLKRLGTVTVSQRVARDIRVQLTSSAPGSLAAPPFVTIRAGEKSVDFELSVVDGATLDGPQSVTISAHVPNWSDGADSVLIQENDRPILSISVPETVSETAGVLLNAGEVRLVASVSSNLTVRVISSNPARLAVPEFVSIPAGTFASHFSLRIQDNATVDGLTLTSLSATAPGFSNAIASVQIIDDETPPVPYLPSPADLSTNVPVDRFLSWQSGAGEILLNGSFETGDFAGWNIANADYGSFVINDGQRDPEGPDFALPPYQGKFSAMTDQVGGGSHILYQDVFIPADAQSATLSWVDMIRNHGTEFSHLSQEFRVEIRDLADNVLALAFTTKPGDALTNDWTRREFDLSNFRGQWVRVAFIEEDHLGYFNVHLDEVSVRLGNPGAMAFEVYWGTNPVPGQAEFLGTTLEPFWKLPRLALDQTYYWRVVSRMGTAHTEGPVWRFSTRGVGVLHHFEWTQVGEVQKFGQPIPASVTAKDDIGNTLTNFSGPLTLSARFGNTNSSVVLITEFDTGSQDKVEFANATAYPVDISGWQIVLYDSQKWPNPFLTFRVPSNTVCEVGDVFLLNRDGTTPGQYPNFFMGDSILWNNGVLGNPVAIALLDSASNMVDFVSAFDAKLPLITKPAPIPAVEWIGNPLAANTNVNRTWQRVGLSDRNSSLDWILASPSPGNVHSNLSLPFALNHTFAVSPQIVRLTNGLWSGSVTVSGVQSNVVLLAADSEERLSSSNPFRIEGQNDLSIEIQPPNTVTPWGQNFVSSWTIRNSGPEPATNVRLLDSVPPALTLLSATPSQGTCLVANGDLFCLIGDIAERGSVSITLIFNATQPGFATNTATVLSDAGEMFVSNNIASGISLANQPYLYSTNLNITEGNKGTNNALFIVRLSAPAPLPVRVDYATTGFTATAGSDFIPVSGTLVFAPGVTNLTIPVPIVGDTFYENLENFFLNFSPPVNATLATPQVRGRIFNDDDSALVSISDAAVTESPPGTTTNAVFKVTLNTPSGLPVSVDFTTYDNTAVADKDYVPASGTLTFPPGVTNLEIIVPIIGDKVPETNETFYVALNNIVNADVSRPLGTCTILDNGRASLDHFKFSVVPSPQQAGQSFPVTISALDAWDRPFTDFNGLVSIRAISSLETFLIGTGKVASPNPFAASFHDNRTEIIYTTNELLQAGNITAISLQVATPPGQTLSNWTIRMKHTGLAAFHLPPAWESEGWVTVYQRDQNIEAAGWATFFLDTPFSFNGSNNVLVDFSFNNDSYSSDGLCQSTETKVPRVIFARTDSAFGDPLDWSGIGAPPPRVTDQVPNTQFVIESTVAVSPATAGSFVQGTWTGAFTIQQAATNIFLRAIDQEGHAGTGNLFAVDSSLAQSAISSRITSIQLLNRGVAISFTSVPGHRYVLETTANLVSGTWKSIQSTVTGTGSTLEIIDPDVGLSGDRFYRIREIP
jgi:uncharacterized repeat protein (TIGR01451 family)